VSAFATVQGHLDTFVHDSLLICW